MNSKTRIIACFLCVVLLVSLFAGCTSGEDISDGEALADAVSTAVSTANSVEAEIVFEMQARIGATGNSDSHTASIGSNITVNSTFAPAMYHAEYFSRIIVDGLTTSEDQEFYVVADEGTMCDYVRFEYDSGEDIWTRQTLTREEVAALPVKTAVIGDWDVFFKKMTLDTESIEYNGKLTNMYSGSVDSSILQELIGDKVFGSFLHSVEQLIEDEIQCTVYIEQETYLPVALFIEFNEAFIVSDMVFDSASVSVEYSDWGQISEIDVPKKVSIGALDTEASFYASYFAWNLFLPYINGESSSSSGPIGDALSFTSAWNTFQIRIDNGLTTLPIPYSNLQNIGYSIEDTYDNIIIEPNKYIESVPVYKGRDRIFCAFYNDDTVAQPITNCKIGCIDIFAADQVENGIRIYLPGEICLGVTDEFLFSAYDDPTESISAFSSDTHIWRIPDVENQSFMAEVSPVTKQVIRLQLRYIPVTGGVQ